ncbi:TIGR04222 domain-containing membrane protein [Streptomyces sp. NPDC059564]|uniref:TIGR04222 domain-containing membrane protein n=1 Tax=Streptomyces sp. NPDC059564 TaxID=3346865 RepID=UPI0036879460
MPAPRPAVPGAVNALAAAAWPLLLVASAMRLWPGRRPSARGQAPRPLSPVEMGMLRGGERGAGQTALVELYLAGSVEATWQRTVRRQEGAPSRGRSELARAQYGVLHVKRHPGRLRRFERVQQATEAVSHQLEREGLLLSRRRLFAVRAVLLTVLAAPPLAALAGLATGPGPYPTYLVFLADGFALLLWMRPRRTRHGDVLLHRLRREHARVRQASERAPAELLLSVALFGATALREQLPRFTAESGLLTRPPREPMDRGGGGSGEAFASCGG